MDPTTAQLFMLNNIKSVDGNNIAPSELTIDKTTAFPLFNTKQGKLIAAGGFHNDGKVVVVGHEAILGHDKDGDNHQSATFTLNAIRWLTGNAKRVGMMVSGYSGLRSNVTSAGMSVSDVKPDELSQKSVDVVFADTYTQFDDNQLADIYNFISGGGGLLYGGHNWYYKRDWVNKILQGSGISVTEVCGDGYQIFSPVPPLAATSVPHLIDGVNDIVLDGLTPGTLCLFDDISFSFVDRDRNVIAAGSHCGIGRMIHFGHEAIVNIRSTTNDTLRLVKNSISWLTRMKQKQSVGFLVDSNGLKTTLEELGHSVKRINIEDDLSPYSLLVTTTYTYYTNDQLQKMHTFVENGGSLLTGGHDWSGAKTYGDILIPGGIFLTNSYTGGGNLSVTKRTVEKQHLLNTYNCVISLTSHIKDENVLSFDDQGDIAVTVRCPPLPTTLDKFWTACNEFLEVHPSVIISSLDTNAKPVEASYVYIFNAVVENEDVNTMKHYPEADAFPGKVPSHLNPQRKSLIIEASFAGLPDYFPSHSSHVWRSTGIYAAPSVPITVTVPPEAVNKELGVLIGCHVDNLTKLDTLKRYPRITRSFKIVSDVTKVANVFGGLVYITVPAGVNVGKIQVTIDNGYISPEFVLGTTDDNAWKKSLADNPVPYCELISDSMILTAQTSEATNRMTSATDLMKIYRDCVDVTNLLSGLNPQSRARGERFVLDVQISAGYMHAGYPIMGPTSASNFMLDNDAIRRDGNMWGPIHEIGHQYQTKGWTPSGGGEATNNIFSVYGSETVLKTPREKAHGAIKPSQRQKTIDQYIKDGRKYEDWNVWTCLETYLQLQEAFGWDFFVKILGEYNQTMTKRPSSNQDILDEWMKRSSRITGYNLGPFYKQGWGWPVSQDALDEIANLKDWTTNPMPLA